MSDANTGVMGYVGEKKAYLYFPCNDYEKLDVLDRIRVAMIQNREKPSIIQTVTRDYLRQRRKCGLKEG